MYHGKIFMVASEIINFLESKQTHYHHIFIKKMKIDACSDKMFGRGSYNLSFVIQKCISGSLIKGGIYALLMNDYKLFEKN